MVSEILCPDCGGVVGATETTDAGPPCKCFLDQPTGPDQSETMHDGAAVSEPAPVATGPAAVQKICRICGKDVAHEKRAKDHTGYYCIPCAKEEEKKEHQGRVRCRVCGHLVKEENLTEYEGTKMCSKCNQERQDKLKQQIKRIGIHDARTRAEWSRMSTLFVVLGVLLLIIIVSSMYVAHRH